MAGGLLTQYLGWRAVFLVNPPIIALMLALVPRLPAGKRSGGGGIDVRGALLVTTGIAALIGAILAGYVYFASLYLQKVLGFSPVEPAWHWSRRRSPWCSSPHWGLTAGASYPAAVLPGLILAAAGVGLAMPTALNPATSRLALAVSLAREQPGLDERPVGPG